MTVVGIVGYYDAGNFGDDLMALAVAREVERCGYHPLILTSNSDFGRYEVAFESNVAEFFRVVDSVVLGGGGALLEHSSNQPKSAANLYSKKLLEVTREAARKGVPLFAVSIGGESIGAVRPLRSGIVSFLTSPTFREATVRLKEDVRCLEFLGAKAEYFPDILLSVGDLFAGTSTRVNDKGESIGIQCDSPRVATCFAKLAERGNIGNAIFIHTSQRCKERLLRKIGEHARVNHYVASDVFETVQLLSALSVVVCHRLHVGVVAAALGSRFMLVEPQPKAVRFFNDIGVTPTILDTRWPANLRVRSQMRLQENTISTDVLQHAIECSRGHAGFIRNVVCGNRNVIA